jgi:nucleotide-binding universal stress UspA family protein
VQRGENRKIRPQETKIRKPDAQEWWNILTVKARTTKAIIIRRPKQILPRGQGGTRLRIKTIVVPVDLTAASKQAVSAGQALARQMGARLVLLNVVGEVHNWKDFGYGPVDWPHKDERALKRSRRALEGLRCRAAKECVLCTVDVRSGDPANQIVHAALALNADLIVMATRHLADAAVESNRPSSVAEEVLRRTHRPVLLLPVSATVREQ